MSDLLLALARRSLQPPAIRPRIGSRFENDARVPRDVEQAPESQLTSTRERPTATAAIPVTVQPRAEPSTPIQLPVTPVLRQVTSLLHPMPPVAVIPPPMPGLPQTVVSSAFESPKGAEPPRSPLPLPPLVDTAQGQPPCAWKPG